VLPQLKTAMAAVAAVEQELRRGEAAGYTKLEVWRGLNRIGCLKMARQYLSSEQQAVFDRQGQAALQRLTSFTDLASVEALEHLQTDGILSIIAGKISRIDDHFNSVENSLLFEIGIERGFGVELIQAEIVINCLGVAPLRQSHNSLIRCLIERQFMIENESGMGVQVNSLREASPRFFVVGALTSGGTIPNCKGELKFHLARHTMPYVLEDADAAGRAIGDYLSRGLG
jgi:hypothetical protein